MKTHTILVRWLVLVTISFWAPPAYAEVKGDVLPTPLWEDPRVLAALVAAAVSLLVNFIGKLVLDRRLEAYKAGLSELTAENEARIQYELEAKKRLYNTVGHLRFQLLIASRDVAKHVATLGKKERRYPTNIANYYGQSTLYRLIKPIALCEMIERQISLADFSVDADAVALLRFKRSVFAAFSSAEAIGDHPDANWQVQEQHIFYHSLSRIAHAIILDEDDGNQVLMPFHTFQEFLRSDGNVQQISPFPELLEDFSLEAKPLLWTRLIFYGFLCAELVNSMGSKVGFEKIEFPTLELIAGVPDQRISDSNNLLIEKFVKLKDAGI